MLTLTKMLRGIRAAWVAGFSLLFILNLDQFGSSSGLGPAPKYWSVGAFIITAVLFLPWLRQKQLLRKPLMWWAIGYLMLSLAWVLFSYSSKAAYDGMVNVVTACLYIGMSLIAYPKMNLYSRWWGATLWLALALGVTSVVVEYFFPVFFIFAEAGAGVIGRAAGFYLNPNIAAQVFLLLLACLIMRGTPSQNLVAATLALLGLLLALSRAGLIAWGVMILLATLRGQISRRFLPILLTCTLLAWFMAPVILDASRALMPDGSQDVQERLAWLLGQGELKDDSASGRESIARIAWELFLDSPFVGHGIGYMLVWTQDFGTHNLVLRHLIEYGAIGALVFPLFLLASIRSAANTTNRAWQWQIAGIALFWSLFSHNILEQANFVLPWLALCLMQSGSTGARARFHNVASKPDAKTF